MRWYSVSPAGVLAWCSLIMPAFADTLLRADKSLAPLEYHQAKSPTRAPLSATALRPSVVITPYAPDGEPLPTFLSAQSLAGVTDFALRAVGEVSLRKQGMSISADQLDYQQIEDEAEASGNVVLRRSQDTFSGPHLRLRVEDNTGYFDSPSFFIPREQPLIQGTWIGLDTPDIPPTRTVTGRGTGERLDFAGENQFILYGGRYSTCQAGDDSWYISAPTMQLDFNRNNGETGAGGKLVFHGMPLIYSPWGLSFPIEDNRRSGFLSPAFGTTNTSGIEFTAPWYWNIAPNMDATIAPRVMAKRGVQINTEFRYLEPTSSGTTSLSYLPNDQLAHIPRYAYSIVHAQNLPNGFSGQVNYNAASDNNYNTDLSGPTTLAVQNSLLRQASLTYNAAWWSATANVQRYQILQDPLNPTPEPYRLLPQLTFTASRNDLADNLVFNFSGDYSNFYQQKLPSGERVTLYPQFSLPLNTAFFQFTPKVGLHWTDYNVDYQPLGAAPIPVRQQYAVPVYSVDSTLSFERETRLFDHDMTQTFEPRVFYVRIPYVDQANAPVFDSTVASYNYAQLFTENRYIGNDRVGDTDQITLAATSRLLDATTGGEILRASLGQILYFQNQYVTLPATATMPAEPARVSSSADILVSLSGLILPHLKADTTWQYSQQTHQTNSIDATLRYQPEIGKVLNLGYSFTRDTLQQNDISAQWPLGHGWYGVGRYNYDLISKRLILGVAGIEYDAGCWLARIALQSLATQTERNTVSILLQLEFNGFSRIRWSNPVDLFNTTIPGYWRPNMIPPAPGAALR